MDYKYKVSVIMGVYNEVDTVLESIECLLNQSFSDLEIIICDDGSTDGTAESINNMAKQYSNITFLQNEQNMGIAYSLNRCIDIVQGEYLARMDADDMCHKDRFKKQVEFLDNHLEYDLVGSQYIMYENGNRLYSHKKTVPDDSVLPIDVPFAHPTIMIRKVSMDKLGRYNDSNRTRYCEDLELWYRFFYLNLKGYNLSEYLYFKNQRYYHHPKIKLRYGLDLFVVNVLGLNLIKANWYRYFFALKSLITVMVPDVIKQLYHKVKFKNKI